MQQKTSNFKYIRITFKQVSTSNNTLNAYKTICWCIAIVVRFYKAQKIQAAVAESFYQLDFMKNQAEKKTLSNSIVVAQRSTGHPVMQ